MTKNQDATDAEQITEELAGLGEVSAECEKVIRAAVAGGRGPSLRDVRAAFTGQQRWAEDLVRRVGLAMKKARGNKSAKWLSDETAALGYRVSPTVIAKLDSGHRGAVLSVAELMVLAAALDIPPGLLLFPGYPTGDVEFLPGRETCAAAALDWFSGEGRLPLQRDAEGNQRTAPPNGGTELVRLMRRLNDNREMLFYLQTRLEMGLADRPDLLKQQMDDLTDRMDDLKDQIAELSEDFEIVEKPR